MNIDKIWRQLHTHSVCLLSINMQVFLFFVFLRKKGKHRKVVNASLLRRLPRPCQMLPPFLSLHHPSAISALWPRGWGGGRGAELQDWALLPGQPKSGQAKLSWLGAPANESSCEASYTGKSCRSIKHRTTFQKNITVILTRSSKLQVKEKMYTWKEIQM